MTEGNTMGTLVANIELEKATLNKRLGLTNIYYDSGKWELRPDAQKKLNETIQFLQDNPEISVELGSHTDSRGTDTDNLELSQKRAEGAVAYIVSAGIDPSRISAKGYGESQLTNKCANGVSCSDAEHAANRRTELRITGVSQDDLEYLRWKTLEDMIKMEKQKPRPRE
jgi:outer membrane protein OmpA-like peptidoglycan-associated protein